jgi:hypothetical protein
MDVLEKRSVSSVQVLDGMRASIRKRTYNLDGEMIERVRRLYDAKTDTEAIQKALRKAIEDREIEDALDALLRAGRFRTVYR